MTTSRTFWTVSAIVIVMYIGGIFGSIHITRSQSDAYWKQEITKEVAAVVAARDAYWKSEIVERGYGQYHIKTRVFHWNESEAKAKARQRD